jgi:hypothetical protein
MGNGIYVSHLKNDGKD